MGAPNIKAMIGTPKIPSLFGTPKVPTPAAAPRINSADATKAQLKALAYAEVERRIRQTQGRKGQFRTTGQSSSGALSSLSLPKIRLPGAGGKTLLGQ